MTCAEEGRAAKKAREFAPGQFDYTDPVPNNNNNSGCCCSCWSIINIFYEINQLSMSSSLILWGICIDLS